MKEYPDIKKTGNIPNGTTPQLNNAAGGIDGWTCMVWQPRHGMDIEMLRPHGQCYLKPTVGQMFIFPNWLHHEVYPFSGEGERLSIAMKRLKIKSGNKKLLQKPERKEIILKSKDIDYKYNEGNTLAELQEYIDSTYDEHYSKNKFQATEFIIDGGHGEGFCIGNIMKYAQRYGKKNGKSRSDLLKVIHYGMIALYINELESEKNET